MKRFSSLIEGFPFQISTTVFFISLISLIPFSGSVPRSYQMNDLSVRCFIIDALTVPLFLRRERFKLISIYPLTGIASSIYYLLSRNGLALTLSISSSIAAVISAALLAFTTIKSRIEY